MKRKQSLLIAACLLIGTAFWIYSAIRSVPLTKNLAAVETINAVESFTLDAVKLNEEAKKEPKETSAVTNEVVPLAPQEYFRTVIDEGSGQFVVADVSKKTVSLKDKYGNEIWKTVDLTAIKMEITGPREIVGIKLINNNIVVRMGKSVYSIDRNSGEILSWGSN